MNFTHRFYVVALGAVAALGLHATPASAQTSTGVSAGPSYTCISQVSTKTSAGASGTMSLGQSQVSNVGACHANTRLAFKNNKAWSEPAQVCSRYPGLSLEVMASDYYLQLGNSAGVNHVESFTVTCSTVPVWDHSTRVVPHTL